MDFKITSINESKCRTEKSHLYQHMVKIGKNPVLHSAGLISATKLSIGYLPLFVYSES